MAELGIKDERIRILHLGICGKIGGGLNMASLREVVETKIKTELLLGV